MKKKFLAAGLSVCLFISLIAILNHRPRALGEERRLGLEKKLSVLGRDERKSVEQLFIHHFFFSDFACTLFGSKPMSIGRLIPDPKGLKGWNAWEKIRDRFQSNEFVIRKYEHNNHDFVLAANLKQVESIYRQNEIRFNQAFQGRLTLTSLIDCIKQDGPLFHELIDEHESMGILLGYGARNSELFAQNQKLPIKNRVPLYPFSKKIHPFFYLLSQVMPVSFACDPTSPETEELKLRYSNERRGILKMAKRDPLFLQMLAKLSENCGMGDSCP